MKAKFNGILALFMALIVHVSYAQEKTISGTVSDESGPLPGVSVLIKGTSTGTETDFNGKYTIKAKSGDVLVFSFLGMKTAERTVRNSNTINVTLQSDDNVLDEVVVVGFGTQSKRKLTDNVVKIKAEDLADIPTPNVLNSIAGRATGVQVRQTNGKVEGGLTFRIRGQSSIGAGTNPLYVLDGVPLINNNESSNGAPTNPLLTLNPNEIESIDILKDASSAAIYGARGANGVVIITTKKGREGRARFSIDISNGVSEASNKRDWLNAREYVELFLESGANSPFGNLTGFVEGRFDRYSNNTDWRNAAVDTDWQDIALRRGHTRDIGFSVTGGTAKTSYFFSTSYNNTKGIVLGNALERLGTRVNVSHQINDRLKLGSNLSFSRVAIDRIANDNQFVTPLQAIAQAPISPAYDANGEPFTNTVYANFLLEDKYGKYKTIVRRVTGTLTGEYKILPYLKFNSNFGYDLFTQTEDQFRGRRTPFQSTNGQAFASNVDTESYNFSNYFTFDKQFGEDHDLNVILGTEFNRSDRRRTSVTGTQFPEEGFQSISSAASITAGTGTFTTSTFMSYFVRGTYSLKDKYLFKASFRRDGSSRFGKANRYGNFSSFSAGWILSKESFLENSELISFLKLRGSYGTLGNAEIGNFSSLNLFGAVSYNKLPGIAQTQAGDRSLKWESSNQFDLGVEFALLNNKISGEFTYYNKDTRDLLFARTLPGSSGVTTITQNIGQLTNNGIEFTITSKNWETENFSWSTSINLGQNKNVVESLPNGNADQISGRNILRKGEAVNSYFLIEYAGVDPANGDALYYRNTNNNGVIDRSTTNNPNQATRIIAGNPNPEWVGGLTNTITYKDFDFTFTFGGEWGASIYNSGGRFQSANADWFDNQTADQLRRWRNPGDVTDVPQARLAGGNGTAHSTRYLEEADFIRLRNLTVGYTIPKKIISKAGLERVRLYFSGLNLFTFTDYTGYDPESRSDAGGIGQVFYSAPAARTYSIGVNIGF